MLAIYLTAFSLFSIVDAADSLQLPQQLQLQASLHRWAVPEYRAEIPDFGRITQPLPFLFFRPLSHYLALQFPFSICLFQSPTLLFLLLFCCIRLTDIYIFVTSAIAFASVFVVSVKNVRSLVCPAFSVNWFLHKHVLTLMNKHMCVMNTGCVRVIGEWYFIWTAFSEHGLLSDSLLVHSSFATTNCKWNDWSLSVRAVWPIAPPTSWF